MLQVEQQESRVRYEIIGVVRADALGCFTGWRGFSCRTEHTYEYMTRFRRLMETSTKIATLFAFNLRVFTPDSRLMWR